MRLGFIGLGRMGSGIATRVLGLGHPLRAYDSDPNKIAAIVAAGAAAADSVQAAAGDCDVVVTMLPDDNAMEQVAYAPDGLIASLRPNAIHLAMGTHGVTAIQALDAAHARAGQTLVAAPVLGRPDLAATGALGIVAAGPAQQVTICAPLFAVIGRRTFVVGTTPASASAIKIANNFLLGCAIEAMGEAFALTRKFGVAPQDFYEVVTDGLFAAPAYKVYGQIIVDQAYERVGVTAVIGLKDADLAVAAAAAAQVPLPSVNAWRDRLLGAIAHGDGGKDWAVMAQEQSRASGLE